MVVWLVSYLVLGGGGGVCKYVSVCVCVYARVSVQEIVVL